MKGLEKDLVSSLGINIFSIQKSKMFYNSVDFYFKGRECVCVFLIGWLIFQRPATAKTDLGRAWDRNLVKVSHVDIQEPKPHCPSGGHQQEHREQS